MSDNWKGRKKGMLCCTCIFWVAKLKESYNQDEKVLGRCRRYAPTMKGWPVLFDTDWCGDHKLDENKI
jgi:hypothetical protein